MSTVLPHRLPDLKWEPTHNCSSRNGRKVRMVVVHRWGVKYTSEKGEAASYEGVINWFKQSKSQVSAHIVYPGSAVAGEATQMVAWHQKAWAEAYFNPDAVEIESADAIWLGHDPAGFHQLARIVGFLLHKYHLPPNALNPATVAVESGFCRHGDLGALGGGHTLCPTTDQHLWAAFAGLVRSEYHRDGYRDTWGKP